MAKIVSHPASRRNVPPQRNRHIVSSEVGTRQPTPACHAACARGQAKYKCAQSSTPLAHSEHSTEESGAMHSRRDLVIKRCRIRSHANTLIFKGRRRLITKWHICKRSRSFGSSWPRRSLYAARAEKLWPLHTHASWTVSDRLRSTISSYRLSSSATRW